MVFGKSGCISILTCILLHSASGQQVITLEQALTAAMSNSPRLGASRKQVEHDRMMEKTSWNLPDPQLILESPSGEFMTLGVEQSMEFPTVYARQKQLARQQTALSEASFLVTQAEVKRRIKQAYTGWQYAIAKLRQEESRDSLYAEIAQSAARQYAAGQIDFVEKTYAEVKRTEAHTALLAAQSEVRAALDQIRAYTLVPDGYLPDAFRKMDDAGMMSQLASDTMLADMSPMVDYGRQNETLAMTAVKLERSKALPDLTIGYLNPADRSTPLGLRMRFGVSVPIWFWHSKANVRAAKVSHEMRQQETDAILQEWELLWNEARNEAVKNFNTLTYYETNRLPQAEEMRQASGRMFEAGAYDYIRYLMTVSDAYRVREDYLDVMYAFNNALIQIQYLNGQ